MRILQVGTGFAPVPPRGAYATEKVIDGLSSALVSLGHEVTVLDIEEKTRPPTPYRVVEVPLRWRKDVNLLTHILRGFGFRWALSTKFKELLKTEHFDIVNFHNQFSASHIPLVQGYNIPVAYTVHNPLWYDSQACQSFWQRLKFFQELKAIQESNVTICLNNITSLNLARHFKIAPSKIAVLPNGIDLFWFSNMQASEAMKNKYNPNDEAVILNVGRISPYKNQLTLAKAIPLVVREAPDICFLFAGPVADKGYARKVRQTISEAGANRNTVFLGEISDAHLLQLYSLCKVFVIPSESEAFPIAVLEAMASGKAVVASDIETFQDKLAEGRGITVPTFDHEALANAIVGLLKNKQLREEMGQRAKEHVRFNYTWESVAGRTAQVYQEVVNGNPNIRGTLGESL